MLEKDQGWRWQKSSRDNHAHIYNKHLFWYCCSQDTSNTFAGKAGFPIPHLGMPGFLQPWLRDLRMAWTEIKSIDMWQLVRRKWLWQKIHASCLLPSNMTCVWNLWTSVIPECLLDICYIDLLPCANHWNQKSETHEYPGGAWHCQPCCGSGHQPPCLSRNPTGLNGLSRTCCCQSVATLFKFNTFANRDLKKWTFESQTSECFRQAAKENRHTSPILVSTSILWWYAACMERKQTLDFRDGEHIRDSEWMERHNYLLNVLARVIHCHWADSMICAASI